MVVPVSTPPPPATPVEDVHGEEGQRRRSSVFLELPPTPKSDDCEKEIFAVHASPRAASADAGAPLTLPSPPPPSHRRRSSWEVSQRPSSKLVNRLQLERGGPDGGLSVCGIFINGYCWLILGIMATIFSLAGAVLLVVSYRHISEKEEHEKEETASMESVESWRSHAKVAGPCVLLVGVILFCLAASLCFLRWKVDREERMNEYYARSVRPSTVGKTSMVAPAFEHRPSMAFSPSDSKREVR